MTRLGLNLSRDVNGVAKKHEEVTQTMFPGYSIHHITNGVHSWTWACDSFKALYDRHIPGWGNDPSMLRHASSIPTHEIWQAHMAAKTWNDLHFAAFPLSRWQSGCPGNLA